MHYDQGAIFSEEISEGVAEYLKPLLLKDLIQQVSKLSKLPPERIDSNQQLQDYGFDSILLMGLAQGLNDHYQIEVTPALFFAYPSLSEFADYLLQTFGNTLFTHYQTKLPTSLQIRNTIEVNANRANTVNASILPAATKRLSLKEEDDAIAIIGL